MKFCTAQELKTLSQILLDDLAAGEDVVVTKNGRPVALMIDVEEGRLDETLLAVRRAKAAGAFRALRQQAAGEGFFTPAEIDDEIAAVRRARA